MNFSPIKPALFVCLLIGSSALGMEPGNNVPQQEQVAPGRYGHEICPICHDDYREFAAEQVSVVFPCGHWVCSDCTPHIRDNRCPYCRVPLPMPVIQPVIPDVYPDLYQAVSQGDLERLRVLIAAGTNVNATDPWGFTLLHHAWTAEAVQILLDAGANVNAANDLGVTPLHWAAAGAIRPGPFIDEPIHPVVIPEVIRALLAAGANVNATCHSGGTPLHGALTAEAIQILLAAGANVNAASNLGITPLHVAVLRAIEFPSEIEQVRALIAAGANVNAVVAIAAFDGVDDVDGERTTPLGLVNRFDHANAVDGERMTVRGFEMSQLDHSEVAEILRQAGAQ